ncbi:hypothetical protein [Kribbella sp. NPDC048928]|uniref:hypothetical protein n=1 Tax=Kribbella sp. NPDC048928 TaxID=3364111 RepID=UPI00371BB57A
MLTRTRLAQYALDAKNDGATHLIIARRPTTALELDPDNNAPDTPANRRAPHRDSDHYAVPVYPGRVPADVIPELPRPVYCIALQDPNLSLRDQLAEHQPWHTDPAPGLTAEQLAQLPAPDPATRRDHVPFPHGAVADADTRAALKLLTLATVTPPSEAARPVRLVTVEELEAARTNLVQTRAQAFSTRNVGADFTYYEGARKYLTELTRAAYEQGRIGPYNVHRITGLHREDTDPAKPAPGTASRPSRSTPLGEPAVIGY